MADAGAPARDAARDFRLLSLEGRAAAVGALLLIASTFGPFSFVEAAEILLALGVLALLRARAEGRRFHLPFRDGTVVAAAGAWAGLLIVVRLLDRPLGQNLLALACAAILVVAGARMRRHGEGGTAERPAEPPDRRPRGGEPGQPAEPSPVATDSGTDPAERAERGSGPT